MNKQERMIELLTGIQSSKRNYYTELKETVHELEKKNIQLEIINEIMRSFNVDMSINDMLEKVLGKLKTIFPIDRISLFLKVENILTLSHCYPLDLHYFEQGTLIPKQQSLYWTVLKTGQAHLYYIRENEEIFEDHALLNMELKSFLLLPLEYKDKTIGILSLGSKEKLELLETDRTFFQQLSNQIAVCLENARLFNEVLQRKKQWEETFQAVFDAIFIIDLNGIILQANKAAQQIFSHSEKLEGHSIHDFPFKQGDYPFQFSPILNFPSSGEILIAKRICEYYCYPVLDEHNEQYASIIYIKDITAKKQIEAQLLQSGKLAAIGEMAAGVAHELNNPLTAIMGNAQLLKRKLKLKDVQLKQLLEDIHECGKRSKNIIRNLLTFSRQEQYHFEKCSVNDAVAQVLSIIGNQLHKQMIEVETKLDHKLPFIDGNLQQIGQIILNLLLNAKDAFEGSDHPKKILLETFQEHGKVILAVTDNGSGIEEQSILEIFNPFFTTKTGAQGTGLGLSVSLGIAEAHGGTIKVTSKQNQGSTFKLILPIKE
ncbi:histidine kinase dimerization/phospho-acceptor domain-containing protein [Robertmurraya sp. DFI.2.37]|uniref:sensor histidine kinase n=1 Tax=Robertmurraya sp. DFI.2.37 TaxID=3031819 RepID=UPI0017812486|nr:GAF domain-containing sensor histidine kinase [Robertmurraya sp. DFI.2.37]MDF1508482.1 histidine kinase dimerization/phospho-acceptor domain-containing protein [Robertmurraya sp. DFI.2.37]